MGFKEVKGQRQAVELLKGSVKTGRVSHAYIFCGPKGVGKNKTAQVFAQVLNCLNAKEGEPCGTCPVCRKIKSGNHPDIIQLAPEKSSLKISQIRQLQQRAYYKCYEGKCKVIVIQDSDLLTTEAANSLLKILEDPPDKTVFILLTCSTKNLPVTILSRCQTIPFQELDLSVLDDILSHLGVKNPLLLSLAQGSIEKALELAEKVNIQQLMTNITSILRDIQKSGYYEIINWAEQMDQNETLRESTLELLTIIYRDKLLFYLTEDKGLLLAPEFLWEGKEEPEKLLQALTEIEKARKALKSNANTRLVFEVLFIKLKKMN